MPEYFRPYNYPSDITQKRMDLENATPNIGAEIVKQLGNVGTSYFKSKKEKKDKEDETNLKLSFEAFKGIADGNLEIDTEKVKDGKVDYNRLHEIVKPTPNAGKKNRSVNPLLDEVPKNVRDSHNLLAKKLGTPMIKEGDNFQTLHSLHNDIQPMITNIKMTREENEANIKVMDAETAKLGTQSKIDLALQDKLGNLNTLRLKDVNERRIKAGKLPLNENLEEIEPSNQNVSNETQNKVDASDSEVDRLTDILIKKPTNKGLSKLLSDPNEYNRNAKIMSELKGPDGKGLTPEMIDKILRNIIKSGI